MKVLVLGSGGQLGQCLSDQLNDKQNDVVLAPRSQIDFSDLAKVSEQIASFNPKIVINAAAYTAVDKAEQDQHLATHINHLAVAELADVCQKINCWLIHMSTDYVFDGAASLPYAEHSDVNPLSIYGESKLQGERAIQASGCRHIIIRTSWVYSEYGSNFLKTMLRLGADRDELNIVADQIGCPTYAQDIAKTISSMLPALEDGTAKPGIYHYCGDEQCSWFGFAQAIFLEAESRGLKTPGVVRPVAAANYPAPASRPPYSVLDCKKISQHFNVAKSNWREGIKDAIDRLQYL